MSNGNYFSSTSNINKDVNNIHKYAYARYLQIHLHCTSDDLLASVVLEKKLLPKYLHIMACIDLYVGIKQNDCKS